MRFLSTESGSAIVTETTGLQILVEGPTQPLQSLASLASYLYQQYADDSSLQAFVAAYNSTAQTYLAWFNATPLAVYTSPNVTGPLLDWSLNGIYGIERPVFSSLTTRRYAGLNALPLNSYPLNGLRVTTSGSATNATDDYYKRVATWILYKGDGPYFNIEVLRKKVARFIYGANGTDITLSQAQAIHITVDVNSPAAPTLGAVSGGALPTRLYGARTTYITTLGETLAGPPASLTVGANNLLTVSSPPAYGGAVGWYPYVGILNNAPLRFRAGLNAMPLNTYALNGTSRLAENPFSRQATTPIAIGTSWIEPTSGLVAGAALPTTNTSNIAGNFIITIPLAAGTASQFFSQAFNQGVLPFPFLYTGTVVIA